jgi:hypothetical protein
MKKSGNEREKKVKKRGSRRIAGNLELLILLILFRIHIAFDLFYHVSARLA